MYGFNEKRSKVLYLAAKDRIPNAIISTCFKKTFSWEFLSSFDNQLKGKDQQRDNVNLNPIDYSLDCLNSFSTNKEVSFWPDLLNSADEELRNPQVELLYQFFRQMAETSNVNLVRNADHLLAMSNTDNSNIVWVGPTKQRFDTTKFKLSY